MGNPSQPSRSSETRARRRIREAAERHGLEVESAYWQPIGQMIEMQGHDGGWTVFIKGYGVATGYSCDDVIESIDQCAPMWLNGSLIG
jgi:hypothetical protein